MSTIPHDIIHTRYANMLILRSEAPSLNNFADQCGISQAQASQITAAKNFKPMGEKLARKVEESIGLARGWLDQLHSEPDAAQALTEAIPKPRAASSAKSDEDAVTLDGLSLVQRAMVTKAAELCRSGYLGEKACLELMLSWQTPAEVSAQ
jgi:hypothetical protein